MTQFILKIDLGNEAMSTGGDIASTLYKVGLEGMSHRGKMVKMEQIPIRDINGNKVGYYEVTE